MTNIEIQNSLKEIVKLLLAGEYQVIIDLSIEKRANSEMLQMEIEGYPGKITLPPAEAFSDYESYNVEDKDEMLVEFFLWFDCKKSDLMITVLYYTFQDKLVFSFWDMLVP